MSKLPPLFPKWPPPSDPTLAARLEHHEAVTQSLVEQSRSSITDKVEKALPWSRLLLLITLLVASALGWLPEKFADKALSLIR